MIIGIIMSSLGAVLIVMIISMAQEARARDTHSIFIACLSIFIFNCLPGLIAIFLGRQLLRGRSCAAVALVVFAILDASKFILMVLMSLAKAQEGFMFHLPCDVTLCLLSVLLLVRSSLAIPDIRRQLQTQRRDYQVRGFPVTMNPQSTPQPPPKSLKQSSSPFTNSPSQNLKKPNK